MNKNQKGFTIIELIVVIAIIAVLASIVLVNVTQYINKGKNAAIQGNMATLLTNSAVYFDGTPSGSGNSFVAGTSGCGAANAACDTKSAICKAITSSSGINSTLYCYGDSNSQAWCGSAVILAAGNAGSSTYCVDSTGYKGAAGSGKCTTGVYTCQ